MKKGRLAFGAIVGAAAGIIAGILTAPKSGRETRADLRERATSLKDEATKHADAISDKTDKIIRDAKVQANTLKDRATSSADKNIHRHEK